MLKTYGVAVICLMLLVAGQTLLKLGLTKVGGTSFLGGDLLANVVKMFSTPYIALGFVMYGISAILWMDVLSRLNLSVAMPMVGLTYVFALIIGAFFFHEPVGWQRILGVAFICTGLVFVVRSQ